MGEDTKECEFWLPPEFLTGDGVFTCFKSDSKGEGKERKRYFGCDFQNEFSYGFNMFGPQSDLSSPVESIVGSTETESDEEDYITELTRQMAHSTLENQKVYGLSSSPQSTLCGVLGSKQGSNSESPNSPFQVCSPTEAQSRRGTVDLLYAAVGEVARMKKMEEEVGIWAPPRKTSPVYVDPKMSNLNLGSFYSNQPPLSYQQFKMAQFQRLKQQQIMKQRQAVLGQEKEGFWQYRLTQNHQQSIQERDRNGGDRPLNMAMSVWPTLQQSHHHHQQKQPPPPPPQSGSGMRAVILGNPGPKRECAGTGVFIPRRVGTPTETRKKPGCSTVLLPDRVVQALNLNLQPQVQPRCNNGRVLKYRNNNVGDQQWLNLRSQPPVAAMSQELQLPKEWTY
ncbi:uncharacterized protein LOC129877667 [Solanum dulcamara]|uniref:uncharacterized protein LOC129877667 n=1 Tax=Solanum dulcamara TaxID=45834 RepID=UPI0024858361|nr:uncharacterized protein LOC129877667 [Solanum dulcamara]